MVTIPGLSTLINRVPPSQPDRGNQGSSGARRLNSGIAQRLLPFSQLAAEPPQNFIELALQGDHLLAHVQRHFGAFPVHTHLFDEHMGDADAVDLIEGLFFFATAKDWNDDLLLLQAFGELNANPADVGYFGHGQIFSRDSIIPRLEPNLLAQVFAVGLIDLVDHLLGDFLLWHAHHQTQI